MNWLDRALAPVFPRAVAKRVQAREVIAALDRKNRSRNFYEGVDASRLRKRRGSGASADQVTERSAEAMRRQARWLEQNFDIAHGALTVLQSNIIGAGILPEPQVRLANGEPATEVNEFLLDLFRDWCKHPEVTGEHDYVSAQNLACRSLFRDGEVFAQHVTGFGARLDHMTRVPYSIELIEADYVPFLDDLSDGLRQGVRKNQWGRPISYRVYRQHPGDIVTFRGVGDTKVIDADNMIHVKLASRIKQTRGVSVFAPVFGRFDDLREIDESERIAARVAAAMTAYIKKGLPDQYDQNAYDSDGHREIEFVPGLVWDDLQPGEDVGTIDSNRPNPQLIPFRDSQLRSAAAALGVSFSSLAKVYDGSYSSQRQELVEQYQTYAAPWQMFVSRFCHPIWERFVLMARQSTELNRMTFDESTMFDCDHSRPAVPWIDPLKEIKADVEAVRWLIQARSDVQRRRGINPQETRQRILRERELDEASGLQTPDEIENNTEGQLDE